MGQMLWAFRRICSMTLAIHALILCMKRGPAPGKGKGPVAMLSCSGHAGREGMVGRPVDRSGASAGGAGQGLEWQRDLRQECGPIHRLYLV